MRISDWSSDVCSSDLIGTAGGQFLLIMNGVDTPRTFNGTSWANASITGPTQANLVWCNLHQRRLWFGEQDSLTAWYLAVNSIRSEEHTSELQSLMRISYAVFCLKKKTQLE